MLNRVIKFYRHTHRRKIYEKFSDCLGPAQESRAAAISIFVFSLRGTQNFNFIYLLEVITDYNTTFHQLLVCFFGGGVGRFYFISCDNEKPVSFLCEYYHVAVG